MLSALKSFYLGYSSSLRFKGNQPGQDPNSKINELAMIGDAYLRYAVVTQLVLRGWGNSELTTAISRELSNRALSSIAQQAELPSSNSTHSEGTLLEAMVGLWHMGSIISSREANDVYLAHRQTFESLIDYIVSQCITFQNRNSFEGLYYGESSTSKHEKDRD